MEKDQFVVLYTQADGENGLKDELVREGFCNIVMLTAESSMREAFLAAMAEGWKYVITVNPADGFSAADVAKVANALYENNTRIYAGTRQTPAKQGLPAKIFGFLSGIHINDIESSLLGLPAEVLPDMVGMKGGDKDFLMNVLLEARSRSIEIAEVKTDVPPGPEMGFGILTRSFKLYMVFIKFSISAMIAYVVDIGTFYWFQVLFAALSDEYKILVCTVLSRLLCSIATYILNKGAVFRSQAKMGGAVVRFVILSVAQLVASWLLVWGIGSLLGGSDMTNTLLKVVIDLVIFMVSFTIQRDWVFKKTDGVLK